MEDVHKLLKSLKVQWKKCSKLKWTNISVTKNKCVYSIFSTNMDGRIEILGIWISENESASFG